MKPKVHLLSVALILLISMLLTSCGTGDSVIVTDAPRTASDARQAAEDETPDDFMEITIGLRDSVNNFDPLFAGNLSTMRVLSLIYDGLFTLGRDGEIKEAIANDYTISDDGLEYEIKINQNLFFHDSDAFLSGIGRRLVAADVKWALERTAHANVPPAASELLMNIAGYEIYFMEQRELYDPEIRVLDDVAGISVPDNRTVIFHLVDPDPDFLKKLASPLLFIYPREAVRAGLASKPVGTGAYRLHENRNDERIILTKDNAETTSNRLTSPAIDRIDFVFDANEAQLFQKFARGEIDWIPEIGPETAVMITGTSHQLLPVYAEQYNLDNTEAFRKTFIFLNENFRGNANWLKNRLTQFSENSYTIRGTLNINEPVPAGDDLEEPDPAYMIAFSNDPLVRNLLGTLHRNYIQPESELNFFDTRIAGSATAFYTRQSDSFHYTLTDPFSEYWIKAITPIMQLYYPHIDGIESTPVPWKLFIEPVRVRSTEFSSL